MFIIDNISYVFKVLHV